MSELRSHSMTLAHRLVSLGVRGTCASFELGVFNPVLYCELAFISKLRTYASTRLKLIVICFVLKYLKTSPNRKCSDNSPEE